MDITKVTMKTTSKKFRLIRFLNKPKKFMGFIENLEILVFKFRRLVEHSTQIYII